MRTGNGQAGWQVPAPMADQLKRWPAAFGHRVLVTVDTEEEFDWSAPLSRQGRSVTALAALPAAHLRLLDRGLDTVFLVDHPVAANARAADIMRLVREQGRAEIGAQLHAWVNPPFDEALNPFNSFAGNLPRALEAAKLDSLTATIAENFGAPPRIFRAGRYGIGPNTRALLRERGYRVDSSVRASYDYRRDGGPDFRRIGPHAFDTAEGVLSLPLTTVFTGAVRRGGARLYDWLGAVPKARGAFARARLLQRVALTPEDMPLAQALEAIRVALDDEIRLLVLAFHSPSLVPGHTPYVRDARDLATFWAWWDGVLELLDRRGVRSASLDDILAAAG